MEAASVAEEVPGACEGGWFSIEFISDLVDPGGEGMFLLVLVLVGAEHVPLLLHALGLAGLLDALPEVVEEVVRKHEFIHLLLGLAGVVLVVDTVELEPLRFVHAAARAGEGYGEGGLSPDRRKLLELHITSLSS